VDIKQGFDSNYRYVLVAARRARQLQGGSQPLVSTPSAKACRVAQDELDAGLVGYRDKPKSAAGDPPLNDFGR
jgi:DNA-directed RNA polymerase subunit omega